MYVWAAFPTRAPLLTLPFSPHPLLQNKCMGPGKHNEVDAGISMLEYLGRLGRGSLHGGSHASPNAFGELHAQG